VLDIDHDRQRISLGLKQTQEDPWQKVIDTHHIGDVLEGTVTKIVSFGAFVEIYNGVEGLVHISELSEQHVENPRQVLNEADVVRVRILEIDTERRRLSLSAKQVEGQNLIPVDLGGEDEAAEDATGEEAVAEIIAEEVADVAEVEAAIDATVAEDVAIVEAVEEAIDEAIEGGALNPDEIAKADDLEEVLDEAVAEEIVEAAVVEEAIEEAVAEDAAAIVEAVEEADEVVIEEAEAVIVEEAAEEPAESDAEPAE
jgi:small subunit ribosomal protein S1